MGFSNTQYTNTIDNLVSSVESKLSNPYYKFSDKKPTTVTYYKQNIKKSTLDCASELQYAHVSKVSALKYNKINSFALYGIDKMTVEYEVGENGTEANPISGDAYILPNTIEPLPGDFFAVPQIKEDVLFKVDSVTPDTLDTGANFYKIEYHLELTNSTTQIEEQVVNTFTFVADYVGTEFNCLISSDSYELGTELEEVVTQLIDCFNGFFYSSKVQTYTYLYDEVYRFYDPYMIEFIRRNKLLGDVYVAHQTTLEQTFSYEYSRCFFAALENKDMNCIGDNLYATANLITQINSLFTSRIEDYYQIKYMDKSPLKTRVNIFSPELIAHIKSNTKFTGSEFTNTIYNLIISYMNDESDYIDESIIEEIHKMDIANEQTCFYMIPIYIFIIKNYINSNILSTQTIE